MADLQPTQTADSAPLVLPTLLKRCRRVGQALFAVVMEACVHGVSTRRVDDPVEALARIAGSPNRKYPRSARGLDAEVARVPQPHPRREPPPQHVPRRHLLFSQGRAPDGVPIHRGGGRRRRRRPPVSLGLRRGNSQNEDFLSSFLRSLNSRGLDRVRLVMPDAHSGLKKALGTAFQGTG